MWIMVRQCAWCLRLIDDAGERISLSPLPKLYEASHGICEVCGSLWLEQVLREPSTLVTDLRHESSTSGIPATPLVEHQGLPLQVITDLILQLQQRDVEKPKVKQVLPRLDGPLRMV
jgi:hypothetical protein